MSTYYVNDFKDKCANCTKYDIFHTTENRGANCKRYCSKELPESRCKYSFSDANRDNNTLKELIKSIYPYDKVYYVICAIQDILNIYEDDVTNIIIDFIKNSLRTDSKYFTFLNYYDQFGPVLANTIKNKDNSIDIATHLYNNYLIYIFSEIKNNNDDNAFNLFCNMIYEIENITYLEFSQNNNCRTRKN